MFQEERPVWYTIHCNVLPKDNKEAKVVEEFKNEEIVMVTDTKDSTNDDSSN